MREFSTGATRDDDTDKLDYEGFLSPIVLERYAEYMHHHRTQADGELRASDNWQKGIDRAAYMKSLLRHVHDAWMEHRGYESREGMEAALCGILFNTMGLLHEVLLGRDTGMEDTDEAIGEDKTELPWMLKDKTLTTYATTAKCCATCRYGNAPMTQNPMPTRCDLCHRDEPYALWESR